MIVPADQWAFAWRVSGSWSDQLHARKIQSTPPTTQHAVKNARTSALQDYKAPHNVNQLQCGTIKPVQPKHLGKYFIKVLSTPKQYY